MFTEDLTPFFDADGFGISATLDDVDVVGIFDQPYAQSNVGLSGIASDSPTFMLKTADVPSNVEGGLITVKEVDYQVVRHEPDGTGMSTLVLERVAA